MFWKRGCLQTASLYTKIRICYWLWYYQYIRFMSSLILLWDKLSYVLCLFCFRFFSFPIWDSTWLFVKIPTPYDHFMSVPQILCCCLLSCSLHRRACSHYEKYPLLRRISHSKLSWGEASLMVVLSILPIKKRHVAFFHLDCSTTSDTLLCEFPLLASRTTFFFSFSPIFHFCCFKNYYSLLRC